MAIAIKMEASSVCNSHVHQMGSNVINWDWCLHAYGWFPLYVVALYPSSSKALHNRHFRCMWKLFRLTDCSRYVNREIQLLLYVFVYNCFVFQVHWIWLFAFVDKVSICTIGFRVNSSTNEHLPVCQHQNYAIHVCHVQFAILGDMEEDIPYFG